MEVEKDDQKADENKPDIVMAVSSGPQAENQADKDDKVAIQADGEASKDADPEQANKEDENIKSLSAGQLLWVQGANAAKRDSDMGDQEE